MATMEQQAEQIVDTILEDYRNGRSMRPYGTPSPIRTKKWSSI